MTHSRRKILKRASGTALGALMAGLPRGWSDGAYAIEGPETKQVLFGMIAHTDCASIVMAHELGFFHKYGAPA